MNKINRLAGVRQILKNSGAEVAVFFHLPTIRYLCGFTGSDGALLVGRDSAIFLTDFRYKGQVGEELFTGIDSEIYQTKLAGIAEAVKGCKCSRLVFESAQISHNIYQRLTQELDGVELVPVKDKIERLRTVKDRNELTLLKRAAALHVGAIEHITPMIIPGVAEQSIAWELEKWLREAGADERSFDFIVASGPRGAMPHGIASTRALRADELVTIDFGVYLDGYASDETVTFALGSPEPELRKIYDIVYDAQQSAMAAVSAGKTLKEIDAIARDMIDKAGYSAYFGHGLGHGVGLEVHEYPALNPRADGVLEAGMVITIEPGIYLPDRGGVRLEDTILVTETGYERITQNSKKWQQLPV